MKHRIVWSVNDDWCVLSPAPEDPYNKAGLVLSSGHRTWLGARLWLLWMQVGGWNLWGPREQ